jgi:hypothetical protein
MGWPVRRASSSSMPRVEECSEDGRVSKGESPAMFTCAKLILRYCMNRIVAAGRVEVRATSRKWRFTGVDG